MFLLSGVDDMAWEGNGWDRRFKINHVPSQEEIRNMPAWMVSRLIDALKGAGYGRSSGYRRWATEEGLEVPDYDYTQ
jgi:hypothetical protein